tara:strand:- start:290 stop:982 length:693 start_codon:yes stop_codon:yes gene_type:complete
MNLEELENKHLNKDCVILTCGPSLVEYPKEVIEKFCQDKIVICVKEAVLEFQDICNYHIINATRMRPYNIKKDIIRIIQANRFISQQQLDTYDYYFKEVNGFNPNCRLLIKKNYHDFNIKNNKDRQWGPGILYETVFYLCLYMGIKNVYTVGWDLIDTSKTAHITHYFEKTNNSIYNKSVRWRNFDFRSEMDMVNNNIPSMCDYFKSQGMNLTVVGNKSFVNREIPRITL